MALLFATVIEPAPGANACELYETAKVRSAFMRVKKLNWSVTPPVMAVQAETSNIRVKKWSKNGADVIHLATGLVVGYPPCPYIDTFKKFLEERYSVKVVVGTHPIPQKYLDLHTRLHTWDAPEWKPLIEPTLADETTRIDYN